jgi:hypothetical protein
MHRGPERMSTTDLSDRTRRLAWLIFAIPALLQIWRLTVAIAGRLGYDYDLEWMEGGVLVQAQRILAGEPIYQAPSIDYIPFLYPPGYSTVVAAFSWPFELGYALGRSVSIGALIGAFALIYALAFVESDAAHDGSGRRFDIVAGVAATLGVGFVVTGYPFTDAWYDIARPDSLLCALLLAGAIGLRRHGLANPEATETWWQPKIVGWAALLGLAFFVKQTAVLFVVAAGLGLLVFNWRAFPVYVASSGVVGLGGTALGTWWTDGYLWRYIFVYHQRHETSSERFWNAFDTLWTEFPALCVFAGLALLLGIAGRLLDRYLGLQRGGRRASEGLIYWGWLTGVGAFAGATGMATQWAVSNTFMPFIFFGGATVAVTCSVLGHWSRNLGAGRMGRLVMQGVVLGGLALILWQVDWNPKKWVPSAQQAESGNTLVERIASYEGPVFTPYFPWYNHLAGKEVWVHAMGITDTTNLQPYRCDEQAKQKHLICPKIPDDERQVAGLAKSLREVRFDAVMVRPFDSLRRYLDGYRYADQLGPDRFPTPTTGYRLRRIGIWEPERPQDLPADARMLFDFETHRLEDWRISGSAWGRGPVTSGLQHQGQQPVGGYFGERFLNSFHGGDRSQGVATSPSFTVDGSTLHLRVGGGTLEDGVEAVLIGPEGKEHHRAAGNRTEMLRPVTWNVSDLEGQEVRLELRDNASGGWGHLLVDDVWIDGR